MIRALLVVSISFLSLSTILCQQIASLDLPYLSSVITSDADYDFLRVYPNPVEDYVQVTENQDIKSIQVFSLVGKKVKSFDYEPGKRFYMGDIRKGIYLVQLVDRNNKILTTKRVSKK